MLIKTKQHVLHSDTETFSGIDLKKFGTVKYVEDRDFDIMLFAYALDDARARVWDITAEEMPKDLCDYLYDEDITLQFHNAWFDRNAMIHAPSLALYQFPLPIKRFRCTMAQALSVGLPGKLEVVGPIMGIPEDQQKLKIGKELIQLFCKYRKTGEIKRYTRHTHPEQWAQFKEYARTDVESARAIWRKLPAWNYQGNELYLWFLDQLINTRGLLTDQELIQSAITATTKAKKDLATETQQLTNYQVESAAKRDKLLAYILSEYGVPLKDLRADTLERRLDDPELPEIVKDLIRVRLASSMTSTSKYQRMLDVQSSDGRIRGTTQFCGARRSGRWAGRLIQPHNYVRPTIKQDQIEGGVALVKAGIAHLIHPPMSLEESAPQAKNKVIGVMELCANMLRGAFIAGKGRKLCVTDLSNIEGRGLAHLAGEQWKIEAFKRYDAKEGPDLYVLAYARAFNCAIEDVDIEKRQIGKVMELALGYEGGVGAFVTMAATYGLDLEVLADAAWDTLPKWAKEEAMQCWVEYAVPKNKTLGLTAKQYIVCDALKRMWRKAHPATAGVKDPISGKIRGGFWQNVKDNVAKAVNDPNTVYACHGLLIQRTGNWLRIRLPSGRYLCYPWPLAEFDGSDISYAKISYMGVSQYTHKWDRIYTYGGKLVENIVQAFARDVLAHNMPLIEEKGYPILMTVHDEVITEPEDSDQYNDKKLSKLLARVPPWALGLPLAAKGFSGYRMRKE